MIGLDGLSRAVADVIGTDVRDRLDLLEEQLGPVEPNGADPTPQMVFWTMQEVAQLPVGDYPLVMVMGRNTPMMRRVGLVDGAAEFDVEYVLRVLVLVRGEGYLETAALRGRLGLAVREVLLTRQSLEVGARLDESTLSESYSDVQYDAGNESTVAGVYLDARYVAREVLAPRRGGAVGGPVTVTALPLHPALG